MEKKENPEYVVFIRRYANGYSSGIVHSIKCSKYQRRRKNWTSQGEWGSEADGSHHASSEEEGHFRGFLLLKSFYSS